MHKQESYYSSSSSSISILHCAPAPGRSAIALFLRSLGRGNEKESFSEVRACVRAGGRAGHVLLESGVVCSSF